MTWDASTDAVLDWLKNAPAFVPARVDATEQELRKNGVRFWRELPTAPLPALEQAQALAAPVNAIRSTLARARSLQLWLRDLRAALQQSGQWEAFSLDAAGHEVQTALRLHEGADAEFDSSPSLTLAAFTRWVSQALEAGSFSPPQPKDPQVVILPLAQLLGRPIQAIVLPGCDDIRLPVSPEPTGPWTPAQREWLGLPSRQTLAATQRQAWDYAMRLSPVDVLWRTSEGGEKLMPSGFVQELLLDHGNSVAADPRPLRAVQVQPTPTPTARSAEALPVKPAVGQRV